jgi:hypothetical protein
MTDVEPSVADSPTRLRARAMSISSALNPERE